MALTVTRPYVVTAVGGTKSRVALSGTVYAGDPIGFTTGWVQAAAIATAPIPAEFVALEDGISGEVIEVAQQVVISGGISAATLGYPVFLSVTPGEYAQAANGSVRQQVGWVSKADEINIDIGKYGIMHVQRVAADNAALYVRDYMALAAASAYALRVYETVLGVAVGSAYGIHSTISFAASGDVTGIGTAARFTLDSVANQALQGSLSCIMLENNIATGCTFTGSIGNAYIRVVNTGTVVLPSFITFAASAASSACQAKTAGSNGAMTLVVYVGDTPWYVALSASCS